MAASRARSWAWASERPRFRGPKAMSLSTVSSNSWYSGYWNTSPTFLRTARRSVPLAHRSTPSTSTVPEVGFTSPFKCCTRVLLPLPVWPISPTSSPSPRVKLTSCTAAD